jgi:hypothetical protein
MSRTSVGTQTQANVNVWASTITKAIAFTMEFMFRVTTGRGLDPTPLQENFKKIEAGLATWLSLRQLKSVRIEAYEGQECVERWELGFTFNATPLAPGSQQPSQLSQDALEKAIAGMEKLSPGTQFRVVAMLPPDAAVVAGWGQAELLDDSKLMHHDLGGVFDLHHILGKLGLWKR